MKKKINNANERKAEELVEEVENAKYDNRMFKAAKVLHTKHQRIQFVHDEKQRCTSQPQQIQNIIEKHFNNHFNKNNLRSVTKFLTPPKKFNKMITAEEVRKAVMK